MFNKLSIILLVLLLTGCISIYKAPANKPTAFLELDSSFFPVKNIRLFEDEQCANSQNGTNMMSGYLTKKYVASHGIPKLIEANRRFVLSFRVRSDYGYLPRYSCSATGSFYPQPGETYKTTFYLQLPLPLFESEECHLGILRKVTHGDRVIYVPEESYQDSKNECHNFWTDL